MIDVGFYNDNGFLLLKRFFEPSQLDAIRDDAKAVFVAQMRRLELITGHQTSEHAFDAAMFRFFEADRQSFINCGKQAQHLISLHRLSLESRLIATIRQLGMQEPTISTRPLLYFNSPKLATKEVYWRLTLHQDWRSMQGSLDALVVWVPLVDIDTALGALEVIPGSHKWGLLDSDMTDGYGHIRDAERLPARVAVEVEKGDALFFSAFLAHQSGTNSTDSIRWSCHFRYNNLQEPTFVERGFPHPYIYKPQQELITDDFPKVSQLEQLFGQRAVRPAASAAPTDRRDRS